MKKEYLTPNLWVLDLVAACMEDTPAGIPQSGGGGGGNNDTPGFGLPARRGGIGPAGL